jgi:hypothetical protein
VLGDTFCHSAAITAVALSYPALIPVSTFYLLRQLGTKLAQDVANNEINIRFSNGSVAGVARKEDFKKQLKNFYNLTSDGQIGGIYKIYAKVASVSHNDFFNQTFYFFVSQTFL